MKKHLSFAFIFLFYHACLQAQVSVDGSNFTGPSTQITYLTSSPGFALDFDLETAGGDLEWDITDFESAVEQVEFYEDIADMGFFYQLVFSNPGSPEVLATHAIESVDLEGIDVDIDLPVELSDVYQFYRNDTTGYYEVGLAFSVSGFPLVTPYDDTDRIYKFPLTFDERDTSSVAFEIELPTLGFYGQDGMRYSHVDAWGTLTTPYGEYEVLRVRAERLITDTISISEFGIEQTIERPLQIDYAWISPDHPGEILRVSTIEGQVVSIELLLDEDEDVVSTKQTDGDPAMVRISPNPASTAVTAHFPADLGTYFITDLTGKTVASGSVRGGSHVIDVSAFAAGVYLLGFTSTEGHFAVAKLVRTDLR
ncbi:MAG: T9SS type A sorting domain-containing protein [Flavobacteriales bacterium]|nr:T9SS type A sorting domain-containing protein [Flavobacteriales bacterium]